MQDFISLLKQNNLLKIIDEPVDIDLEIAHIAYIEAKKGNNSKALLFTKPISKKEAKEYDFSVLMNTFCNEKALNLVFGRDYNEIANEISKILKTHIPDTLKAKIDFFKMLLNLKNIAPKRLKKFNKNDFFELNSLNEIPILKTWELDGGKFITMGQVFTQNIDKTQNNLGMYRLQVINDKKLLMHWQIHKDGAHFYNEFKKIKKSMPVSITIGGDPLCIWCAQAPLPKGIFELLMYGFIKKTPIKLMPCETNDIFVPINSDFIIEGFVDMDEFALEGPFGDHTGFYTPIEKFPVMTITRILAKKNAIYQATVVGKPPLEDAIMALGTEKIFLPLFQTIIPDVIDYKMPENGVFHNLILAKINNNYKAQASQIMHSFWGIGQMSFVKHIIFVDKDAPKLDNYDLIIPYILDRFDINRLYISDGICDQLDHASIDDCFGGKAAIDATGEKIQKTTKIISDNELKNILHNKISFVDLKQFYTNTATPILCITLNKTKPIKNIFDDLLEFKQYFKCVIFLDTYNHLENSYMLIWRIVNNIDARRDIFIDKTCIGIDASAKNKIDNHTKEWPKQTDCSKDVIDLLIKRKLIENDTKLFEKFEIFG